MKELSAGDLLFGPIEDRPIVTKPRSVLRLESETFSLPAQLSRPRYQESLAWQNESFLLLYSEKGKGLLDQALREMPKTSSHLAKHFRSLPLEHVRDGEDNEVCIWPDGGQGFAVSQGSAASSAYRIDRKPTPFHKGAIFLGAFPREEGIDFFWAQQQFQQSQDAIQMTLGPLPDYELMYATWHPDSGNFGITDSLIKTFYGYKSLALLGESVSRSSVSISREGDSYRIVWMSREGGTTYLKGLLARPYMSSFVHKHLSDEIEGDSLLLPSVIDRKVVALVIDSSRQSAKVALSENRSGTVFGEREVCRGEGVRAIDLEQGFAVAWLEDSVLCFALAGQGEQVFGRDVRKSYSPQHHLLSGNRKHMSVRPETDFALIRSQGAAHLLWISEDNSLLALAWGSQHPEVLVENLPGESKLIGGRGESFYLLSEKTVTRCHLSGKKEKVSK